MWMVEDLIQMILQLMRKQNLVLLTVIWMWRNLTLKLLASLSMKRNGQMVAFHWMQCLQILLGLERYASRLGTRNFSVAHWNRTKLSELARMISYLLNILKRTLKFWLKIGDRSLTFCTSTKCRRPCKGEFLLLQLQLKHWRKPLLLSLLWGV